MKVMIRSVILLIGIVFIVACSSGEQSPKKLQAPILTAIPMVGSVKLDWESTEDSATYHLYVAQNKEMRDKLQLTIRDTSHYFHDNLTNGTTYYFYLAVVGEQGEGNPSSVISVTPNQPPHAPKDIQAIAGNKQISFKWQPAARAESYTIYIAMKSDITPENYHSKRNWMKHDNVSSGFTRAGLENGTRYYAIVTSSSIIGESIASTEVEFIPSSTKDLALGYWHSCTIRADDSMWCWGESFYGQLGNGVGGDVYGYGTPIQTATDNQWKKVSAGKMSTCAIDVNDSLYCWGEIQKIIANESLSVAPYVPFKINDDDWYAVSVGTNFVCGIKAGDQSLWCWGINSRGQLGYDSDGINTDKPQPVPSDEGQQWHSITSGQSHSCAINSNNKLYCWGDNTDGQIGINSAQLEVNQPTLVAETLDWKYVHAGPHHTCAITQTHELYCWGDNADLQLGTGDLGALRELQPQAVFNDKQWKTVSAGSSSTCGITMDHMLYCWGSNTFSHIGDGTFDNRPDATQIGGDNNWASIHVAGMHSCGMKFDGSILCWGNNLAGQSGDGSGIRYQNRAQLQPTPTPSADSLSQIVAGNSFNCGLDESKRLWCWGSNEFGELGLGHNITLLESPQAVTPEKQWTAIFSNESYHSCGILQTDNSLWCWGWNEFGQVAHADTGPYKYIDIPYLVDKTRVWLSVGIGHYHTCAIAADRTLWCWGDNFAGKLGQGVMGDGNPIVVPQQVILPTTMPNDIDNQWSVVTAGFDHTCGIQFQSQSLWCWGTDGSGELGNGEGIVGNRALPVLVDSGVWLDVKAGEAHTCAIKSDNTLWCWGSNTAAAIGNGDENIFVVFQPLQIGTSLQWQTLSVGNIHSCAITLDSDLYCWGHNTWGMAGVNSTQSVVATPEQEITQNKWVNVSAGTRHTCAEATDGTQWCWGSNVYSQLGDGTARVSSPTIVSLPDLL